MASDESESSTLSGFVDNWQGGKSLAQCNLYMLISEESCDVSFRVGGEGQVIKAHRYILISRSCVFYSMFAGPLAETSEVRIPDVDAKQFRVFLKYMYTDDVSVNGENTTALLYLARKYAVTGLEKLCLNFLHENLDAENACLVMSVAHTLDLHYLFAKAFAYVKGEAVDALPSKSFLALERKLVDLIVDDDQLLTDEETVFNVVDMWTKAECTRREMVSTEEAKRSVLGETVKKIRFGMMSPAFVAERVKESGLLTEKDRISVFDFLLSSKPSFDLQSVEEYSWILARPRCEYKNTVCRFSSDHSLHWKYNRGNLDVISFKFLCNVKLVGYRLYGPRQGAAWYRVKTFFGLKNKNKESKTSCSLPEVITEDLFVRDEFLDVLFRVPASLTAKTLYTLAVQIKGPDTFGGQGGTAEFTGQDGVKVTFKKSKLSTNCTDVCQGQIPSLLYYT